VLSFPPANPAPPLREVTAAPDYFARVSEVVLRIESAPDAPTVLELLEQATVRAGADVSAFISFVREDESCESFRFLLACDPQWCVEYEYQARYADHPWLAYARKHSEAISGSEITSPGDDPVAAIRLAERYGFRSTFIVPAPSSGGLSRIGVLALGSSTAGYFQGEGIPALKVATRPLAAGLHEWWVRQVGQELIESARIAAEDIVLLELHSKGLGSKDIARALGSTPSSVHSRFQRLIARLGVANRTAAARLAAEYGLI